VVANKLLCRSQNLSNLLNLSTQTSSNVTQLAILEKSLEIKLPTIWTDGKAEVGRVREEKRREEKIREEKRRRETIREEKKSEEDAGAGKCRKVAVHCVFPMICGSGSKSWLAKAAGAEPSGQMRDEKLHAVVARSTFPSQKVENTSHVPSTFGSCDVEKVDAVFWREEHFQVKMYNAPYIRRTFGSCDAISKKCTPLWREAHFQVKNAQATSVSDHFWKLTCRQSARRCGAKHISKSKCTKHLTFGALLDVQMSFCVAGARDCAPCQK